MDLTACTATELGALLRERTASAREVADAHLARIEEIDGPHSFEGSPDAINAWIRVYPERARRRRRARRRAPGGGRRPAPVRRPARPQGPLRRRRAPAHRLEPGHRPRARRGLRRRGAAVRGRHGPARAPAHARVRGRRRDRPGRQPLGPLARAGRLERRQRRGARLAHDARRDRDRHGRLAAHPLRPLRHVDDQGDARPAPAARDPPAEPLPRPPGADDAHAARHRAACSTRCSARSPARSPRWPTRPRGRWPATRLALSPRIGLVDVDPDVADGFEDALSALRRLGATIVEPPPPDTPLDVGQLFLEVVATDMLSWHAPLLAEKRDDYRQSNRDILDFAARPGDDRHRVRRRPVAAPAGHRRVDGLARRGAHRRDRGADRPDRRPAARARLRRVLHRRGDRLHRAHAHVGLDGHARRLAALGRRPAQRAARERVAHRRAGSEAALLERGIALQDELGVPEPPAR